MLGGAGALELADLKKVTKVHQGPSEQLQQRKHILTQHQASMCFESVSAAMFHLQGSDISL